MDLQHQAVVEAHPRHLGQHLAAEGVGLLGRRLAGERPGEERRGLGARQVLGAGGGVAVVGAGGAVRLEEGPALAVRLEVAVPGRGVAAGDLAEARDVGGEARELGVDHRVGPVGGDDPAAPARSRGSSACQRRSSSGLSVVAITSMLKRSKSARGRNSGPRQAVGDVVVVVRRRSRPRAGGRGRTPSRRCGRARAATACRATGGSSRRSGARSARPSVSVGPPSARGTPRSASGTPCEQSMRKT